MFSFLSIIFCSLLFTSNTFVNNQPSKALTRFIEAHPENSSVYMVQNGEVLFNFRSEINLPALSTTKILVAAAYAQQIGQEQLSANEIINTKQISNLYLQNEKNKKFDKWLDKNKEVQLSDLIRAMIKYNSNAIEEFLIGKLTLKKTNEIIETLGFKNHDKIIPPVSLSFALNQKNNWTKSEKSAIMTQVLSIHEDLANGGHYDKKSISQKSLDNDLSNLIQPYATTKEYSQLLDNILGYEKVNDYIIDNMIPFLIDIEYDENGNEVYSNETHIVQSKKTQGNFNIILYHKKPSSDQRFVSSYFFDNLTADEIDELQQHLDGIIDNLNKGGDIEEIINDLRLIAIE